MKRKTTKSTEEETAQDDEFFEAMPATHNREVYREDPVIYEDDRSAISGWAILGLVLLAVLVLMLLLGRANFTGSGLNEAQPTIPSTETTQ